MIALFIYFYLANQVFSQKFYNSTQHRIKLHGGVGYDYFYVNLYVGNPP